MLWNYQVATLVGILQLNGVSYSVIVSVSELAGDNLCLSDVFTFSFAKHCFGKI
jgi:hypothetical protein